LHNPTHHKLTEAFKNSQFFLLDKHEKGHKTAFFVYFRGLSCVDRKGYTEILMGNSETQGNNYFYLEQKLRHISIEGNVNVIGIFDCARIPGDLEPSHVLERVDESEHYFLLFGDKNHTKDLNFDNVEYRSIANNLMFHLAEESECRIPDRLQSFKQAAEVMVHDTADHKVVFPRDHISGLEL